MTTPFGQMKYLYVGCRDFEADVTYFRDVLGGRLVWNFHAFDAHVAAFELGPGPLVLIADHRPAPSIMPLFIVEDLEKTVEGLKRKGWTATAGPFGIPDGDCYTFKDPSGNEWGFFSNDRPDALVARFEDPADESAVH